MAAAVFTRIALLIGVWISLRALPRLPYYPEQLPDSFNPGRSWLDGWARWDAAHYVAIADLGYGHPDNPSPNGGYGFLPVFPLLLRAVGSAVGVTTPAGYAATAIAVANLCFVIAIVLFVALSRNYLSRQATLNSVWLLLLMPFAFFLNAAYSESLFLCLCLAAFILGDRDRWLEAAAIAAFAAVTRVAGLLIAPALVYGAYRAGVRGWRLAATGLTPLAGFGIWSAYTWRKIGDPFAYFNSQAEWGGWNDHVRVYAQLVLDEPRSLLQDDPRHLVILLNLGLAVVYLAILPRTWRVAPPSVALFTTLIVVLHISWTWVSLGRYMLPAFGVYLAGGAMLANSRLAGTPRDIVFACAMAMLTALSALFALGFWVV
ncbi:membrane protein [soil metagenome]